MIDRVHPGLGIHGSGEVKRLKLGKQHWCNRCCTDYPRAYRCAGIQRARAKRWWRKVEQ